ncbi:MAG: radical SAM protein [Kiritimatiellia bacterium]|nr:radical SAM protein [Lentisphaerota bacterium]
MSGVTDVLNSAACELCPRRCRVRRGEAMGYCGAGRRMRVYRHAPHHGEEPPLSGRNGSGTVFFGSCTMRCVYCQNYRWSQAGEGRDCSAVELADMLLELHARGCHNWNLVSPTPWLPDILRALDMVKARGVSLPVVYNTSGFERPEVIRELGGKVSIYLADLRYAEPGSAAAGSDAPSYVETARLALREMWSMVGPLRLDAAGLARTGLICRVLVLPGRAREACASLEWLAENLGTDVAVSLMGQYTPAHLAGRMVGWNRTVTATEYQLAVDCLEKLGFGTGWLQEHAACPEELFGVNMPSDQAAGN